MWWCAWLRCYYPPDKHLCTKLTQSTKSLVLLIFTYGQKSALMCSSACHCFAVSGGGSGGMMGGGGSMGGGGGGGGGASACEAQAKACRAWFGIVLSSQLMPRGFAITNLLFHHLAFLTSHPSSLTPQAQASASCSGDPTCLANADAAAKAACSGKPGCAATTLLAKHRCYEADAFAKA
jgi:hypothetical protein